MKITDIKTDMLDHSGVIAELFTNNSVGIPFSIGKCFIKPFRDSMKNANNIILFLNDKNDITGSQIGLYDIENGLRVEMF
jgi:hypothetical protein